MTVARSPVEHEEIRRLPLMQVLAYADQKQRDAEAEQKMVTAQMRAGMAIPRMPKR